MVCSPSSERLEIVSALTQMYAAIGADREELISKLAPLGVSFGYQSTAGHWVDTPTETLQLVSDSFPNHPVWRAPASRSSARRDPGIQSSSAP